MFAVLVASVIVISKAESQTPYIPDCHIFDIYLYHQIRALSSCLFYSDISSTLLMADSEACTYYIVTFKQNFQWIHNSVPCLSLTEQSKSIII